MKEKNEKNETLPDIIPVELKLICGCTIRTDQLKCNDPDESVRKDAKAKLICIIEQHMKENHKLWSYLYSEATHEIK